MKTNFSRFGKSAVSVVLSAVMFLSTVLVNAETKDVNADSVSEVVASDSAVSEKSVDIDLPENVQKTDDGTLVVDVDADSLLSDDKSADTSLAESVSTSVTSNTKKKSAENKLPESSGDLVEGNTVGFYNWIGWSNPYYYSFGKSWVEMSASNGSKVYSATIPTIVSSVSGNSFSFSGSKNNWEYGQCTRDLSFSGSSTTDNIWIPTRIPQSDPKRYVGYWGHVVTVYYDNSTTKWDKVYAYAWGTDTGNEIKYLGAWNSCTEMKQVSSTVYSVEVPANINIIFKNSNSSSRTEDLTVPNDNNKIYNGSDWIDYDGSSSGASFSLLYGINNNKPSDFTNKLNVFTDENGEYYADLDVNPGINYYFGLTSGDYTNLYYQGSNYDGLAWEVTSTTTDIWAQNVANYNINETKYHFSIVKSNSSTLKKIRIYILPDSNGNYGYKYRVSPATGSTGISKNVTVYAKSGTIRDMLGYNKDANGNYKYGNFDKYSKLTSSINLKYTDSNYTLEGVRYNDRDANSTKSGTGIESINRVAVATVKRNREITFTVTINDKYKDKYYVKAFCINGKSYCVIDEPKPEANGEYNGTYTCKYTVTDDDPEKIEITPIYYYLEKSSANKINDEERKFITFSVENFSGDVKTLWGNTLACYAYYGVATDYGDNTDPNNYTGDRAVAYKDEKPTLGGYPGQPMLEIDGVYYMQIPKKDNAGHDVEGITLNNYIWDDVHAQNINGIELNDDGQKNIQKLNAQTYDYDDFSALKDLECDKIVFQFKYRTYNSNDNSSWQSDTGVNNSPLRQAADKGQTQSETNSILVSKANSNANNLSFVTAEGGNGWEHLTDYEGYPVDIFERRFAKKNNDKTIVTDENGDYVYYEDSEFDSINENDTSYKDTVYVLSDGYEAYYKGDGATYKYVGQYATKWYVYLKNTDGTYRFIGALPPSAFLSGLKGDDAYTYAKKDTSEYDSYDNYIKYAGNKISSNMKSSEWNTFQTIYDACANKKVVIAYESNIYSSGRNDTAGNPGFRSDGRWTYSKTDAKIKADVRIQVIDSQGDIVPFSDGTVFDTYNEDTHTGSKTNANAYLTSETGEPTAVTGVTKSTNKFTVTADVDSTVYKEDGKTIDHYYIFKGWWTYDGNSVYTSLDKGEKLKDSNVTFVARYQEVDPNDVIKVTHSLLSSITDDENTPNVHNGDGTTTVTVKIYDNENDIVWEKTGSAVIIDALTLARYKEADGYKVEVTLTTETDKDTSVVGVYRRETDTEENDYSFDYYKSGLGSKESQSTGGNIKTAESESIKAPSSTEISVDNTQDDVKVSTLVYTYSFSDFYTENDVTKSLKTKSLDYYSDPETDGLTITHDLYSNNSIAPKDDNSPAVHNGTITGLSVTVSIVDADGNVVKDSATYTGSGDTDTSKSVKLTTELLEQYKGSDYKLKITLPATVSENDNSKVDALYRAETANDNSVNYVESEEDGKEDSTSDWKNVTGDYGATGKTYTYDISKLFTDGNLNTSSILFLSDAGKYVTFSFKYYDREMTSSSQPLDINKKATTISQTIPVTDDTNLESAIVKSVDDLGLATGDITKAKINNNIDQYKFWASLAEAKNSIGGLTRPNGESQYSASIYHTDYYARQSDDPKYFDNNKNHADYNAKWVTYIGVDSLEIKNGEQGESTDEEYALANETYAKKHPASVKEVVIWGYNYPQTYTMTFYAGSVSTSPTSINNVNIYLADTNKVTFKGSFYYNQRVGDLEEGNENIINKVSTHLEAYDIKQLDENSIKAPKVNGKEFDGWYEEIGTNNYVKVSSDAAYGNRVTRSVNLIAGYRDPASPAKGVTVTANYVEKYVSGTTEFVRYTTVLNSYGFNDSDPNFESAAVVYVILGKNVTVSDNVSSILNYTVASDTEETTLKDVVIAQLNKADTDKGRAAKSVTVTVTDANAATSVVYAYDVVPTYTDGTTNTAPTNGQLRLTNKNRVQFSMNLPVSQVTDGEYTNILVFGAVKYADATIYSNDNPNPYKNEINSDNGYVYLASDNYVIYKNGAVVNNTATTE